MHIKVTDSLNISIIYDLDKKNLHSAHNHKEILEIEIFYLVHLRQLE